jgi:hypothetical protein
MNYFLGGNWKKYDTINLRGDLPEKKNDQIFCSHFIYFTSINVNGMYRKKGNSR